MNQLTQRNQFHQIFHRIRNKLFWMRILVITSVMVISVSLSIRPSVKILVIMLGLLLSIGGSIVILRCPSIGLVALVIAGLMVPFSIGTGTQTELNVTVILLPALVVLWVVGMVTHKDGVRIITSQSVLALLTFIIIAVLAFLVGQFLRSPTPGISIWAQLGGLSVFVLSSGAFLLMAHQIRDIRSLQWITWIFLSIGAIYVCGRIIPMLGRYTEVLFQQGATGSMFWIWLLALATSQLVFNRQLANRWRFLLGILILGALFVSVFVGKFWISGWLPSLVAILAVLMAGSPRIGLFSVFILGAVLMVNWEWAVDLVQAGDNLYSLITRQEAWGVILDIVKINPILGLGPANYYAYTPMFPIFGWYTYFSSHNNYIDIFAQTGLFGIICFLWFAWRVSLQTWRLRLKLPEGFSKAYVYGAFGGLVGTLFAGMLGDWFLPFVYNVGLAGMRSSILAWLFLGGVEAIAHFPDATDQGTNTRKAI